MSFCESFSVKLDPLSDTLWDRHCAGIRVIGLSHGAALQTGAAASYAEFIGFHPPSLIFPLVFVMVFLSTATAASAERATPSFRAPHPHYKSKLGFSSSKEQE